MRRALIAIGVDKTGGGLPILHAAADGASHLVDWANSQGFDTTLLTDKVKSSVTLADITSAIHELVGKRVYDQLVVYFSGHGMLKGSNYEVWLLSGAPQNPNEAVNVTGSIDLARNSGIAHVVFISDACRSLPTTMGMNYVLGGVIFPAIQPKSPSPEVDSFYATVPGDPALEVPPDEAAANYRGIFTDCLLKALLGKVGGVIQEIVDDGKTKHVIPSRPLKNYLLAAVPDAASAISIKLQQDPEIRVESDLPKYLAELPASATLMHGPTLGIPGHQVVTPGAGGLSITGHQSRLTQADVVKFFKGSHFLRQPTVANAELAASPNAAAMSKDIQGLLDVRGRESFETRTGFTVHGARVVSAVTTGTPCDVFEESNQSQVRIHIDPTTLTGFAYESRSTIIRFASGGGVCLAALPGYIGTVVVERVNETDRVIAINYTPARGTAIYSEYEAVADDLERRRAFAAVATRNGAFTLDRREAGDAAEYLRMLKAIDPTLGIYAAYAYAQAGDQEGVESVHRYMAEETPFGYHLPVPFDVAMLAFRNGPWPEAYRFPPTLPMLTQGWALLGGLEHSMHTAALKARNYLVPSLWTTFSKEGIDILESAVVLGEFRWI